jgi:hypothetical protein
VRNPRVTAEEREKAAKAALVDAYKLLKPLAEPVSWAVVSWHDPNQAKDPRDLYEAAIGYIIALLDPAIPSSSAQAETYDSRARRGADEFLDTYSLIPTSIVRKAILPALRLGLPPKKSSSQSSSRSLLLRDRRIAAVVTKICEWHGLNPYRNEAYRNEAPLSERPCCGCSIVAEALNQLGIKMTELSVKRIYMRHKQA